MSNEQPTPWELEQYLNDYLRQLRRLQETLRWTSIGAAIAAIIMVILGGIAFHKTESLAEALERGEFCVNAEGRVVRDEDVCRVPRQE